MKAVSFDNFMVTYLRGNTRQIIHYYPGGSIMPGRSFNAGNYRYGGAGGQEMDSEISGVGNSYTAEYWQYDSRLMRRWNVDPVTYPWQSSYAAFNNNPILFVDPLGLEGIDQKTANNGGGNAGDTYTDKNGRIFEKTDLGWIPQTGGGKSGQNSGFLGRLFAAAGKSLSSFDKFMKSGMNGRYNDPSWMGNTTDRWMGKGDYGNYGGIDWYTKEGSPFYNGTVGQAIRSTRPMFVDYEDGSYFPGSYAGGLDWEPKGKTALELATAVEAALKAIEMANEIHKVPKVSSKLQMEIIVDEMDTLQVWRQSGPYRYSVIKDTIFVPNGTIPYETPNGNNSEYVKINY